MSRRQGRISNRDNAKVGAGGRQRGYHKAGRVKKAGSKWSESYRQSRETEYRETEYRETEYRETEYRETEYRETEYRETEYRETEYRETEYRETEYRETLRMSTGAKQDFATCVGKCAVYMWVSE